MGGKADHKVIHEGERVYNIIYIHLYTHARHTFVAYCFVHVKKVWYVLNWCCSTLSA